MSDLCPHGQPLADNTCGPCSQGQPMRPGDAVTCPHCEGRKQTEAHVNYGNGRGAWKLIDCLTCKGVGWITTEHVQRIAEGKRIRDDRVARGVTLRDEAAARGITPVELSRMERGGEYGDLAHSIRQLLGQQPDKEDAPI